MRYGCVGLGRCVQYICVLGSCLKVKELSVVSAGSEAEAECVITNQCTATIQRANQCQMVK